jgi:hypothetical protein
VKRLKTNDTLISLSSNDQVQVIKEFNLINAILMTIIIEMEKQYSHLSLHLKKSCCLGPA